MDIKPDNTLDGELQASEQPSKPLIETSTPSDPAVPPVSPEHPSPSSQNARPGHPWSIWAVWLGLVVVGAAMMFGYSRFRSSQPQAVDPAGVPVLEPRAGAPSDSSNPADPKPEPQPPKGLLQATPDAREVRPASEEISRAAIAVVRGQLTAIDRDDYPSAYTYASDGLKKVYDLKAFERMIRTSYPLFQHAQQIRFGPVRVRGPDPDAAFVPLSFTARDGTRVQAYYILIPESGKWRVAGADMLSAEPGKPATAT